LALCAAAVRTLEDGVAPPELSPGVRTWGAGVPSAEGARAALQCLGEAVSDLVISGFGDFRPRGLDLVLEELAKEAVVPAGRRTIPLDLDALTRCPDRRALERDLATLVTAARTTGEDVTVAVMEPDRPPSRALRLVGSPEPSPEAELLGLLATLRTTFDTTVTVYRAGERSFAVLAPGVGAVAVGESILLATCRGPAFAWGSASLHALGAVPFDAPDTLLLVAEADLHVRRTDARRAKAALTHQRRLSVVSAAAAGLLVVAGAAVGLSGATGQHAPARDAARAPSNAAPGPSGPGVETPEPPSAPPAAPPAPAGTGSGTVVGGSTAPPPPSGSNTVLASFQTPAPAPPAPPPSPTTTTPAPGNSANAPGHLKVNGASVKHA
jgi:GGDEF domain-containing protein